MVCGPYAEPLVSLEREYWLRYPQFEPPKIPEDTVPRVLTPSELKVFLEDATEQELKVICEGSGWVL